MTATPVTCELSPCRVRVLTWPGASADDMAALVGAENVNATEYCVQVRNGDGEWFSLGDGWSVGLRDSDGARLVFSAGALAVLSKTG